VNRSLIVALAAVLLMGGPALAQQKSAKKDVVSFGALRSATLETARGQAQDWLKSVGKTDAAATTQFNRIWDEKADRPVLDRVADTLALGNPEARQLLAEARDPNSPPPTKVPDLVKDAKQTAFFRANLALAYARALSQRRVYEEALEALKSIRPEQVVDPATHLFHKAAAEYSTLQKKDCDDTIARLLDDVIDAPERYKMVAALMHFDMLSWKDKDLGSIARKMDNVERRLELARGGPQTQKQQKEIVDRLDELIKQLENQQKQQQQQQQQGGKPGEQPGGQCPNGGQPGQGQGQGPPSDNIQASSPQQDSMGGNGKGPGNVDPKKLKEMAEVWGKLPERERAKAMLELTRDMPPRYREVIENYFKKLAQSEPGK
jgi:hypothetical protein